MDLHPYATNIYAQSLSQIGQALHVAAWETDVIVKQIDADHRDAFGTYPIAILRPDVDIAAGFRELKESGLVAVTLVLDDFHRPSLADLQQNFDLFRAFKKHAIYRPELDGELGRHHRYEVARAYRKVHVGILDLHQHIDDWTHLYQYLVERHSMSSMHEFPRSHHLLLAGLPAITAVGAWVEGQLVSAHVWLEYQGRVQSHLAGSSQKGYVSGANYAIYDFSRKHFADAELMNLGGNAGMVADPSDGLMRFKSGFANDQADAYICGKILDPERYAMLTRQCDPTSPFFPAYRQPKATT